MGCIGALISFYADKGYTGVDRRIDWIGPILVTFGLVFAFCSRARLSYRKAGEDILMAELDIIAMLIVSVFLVGSFSWPQVSEKC
ncbi:hypothetical protein BDR03DRAFT_961454 [Suillus americanus]|nr:hypothetical protein BDR03DRAFT_961454 [Suillus americanus]